MNPNQTGGGKKVRFNPPAMPPTFGGGMSMVMKLSPLVTTKPKKVDYSAVWLAHGKIPPQK